MVTPLDSYTCALRSEFKSFMSMHITSLPPVTKGTILMSLLGKCTRLPDRVVLAEGVVVVVVVEEEG